MIDVYALLYEICEDERVYDADCDLFDNDLLDSFAMIELFSAFEDAGLALSPTRVGPEQLRTPRGIVQLVQEAEQA